MLCLDSNWWRILCYVRQQHLILKVIDDIESFDGFSAENQLFFIEILSDPLLNAFPLQASYLLKLIKAYVKKIEKYGYQLLDEIASILGDLLNEDGSDDAEGRWSFKSYVYNVKNIQNVTDEIKHCERIQTFNKIYNNELTPCFETNVNAVATSENGTLHQHDVVSLRLSDNLFEGSTGCHEWEAGFVLAEFILNHPYVFKSKSCLELGCGAGLAGIALHRVGTPNIILTDGNQAAVENCQRNLILNGISSNVVDFDEASQRVKKLDGTSVLDATPVTCSRLSWEEKLRSPAMFDVIIGSDILYDPIVIPVLINLLLQLLDESHQHNSSKTLQTSIIHKRAIFATMLRNESTLDLFLTEAIKCGLTCRRVNPYPDEAGTSSGQLSTFKTGKANESDQIDGNYIHIINVPILEKRSSVLIHEILLEKV